MSRPSVRNPRRAMATAVLAGAGLVLAACSSGPPGPPSAASGTVQVRTIPTSVSQLQLTDQQGTTLTLASMQGKTVMLVPFLTLCSDICPMTTGNLLQVEHALEAAHVAGQVQIVELSVDPDRDTQARLAAYAHLTGATWPLVTESDAELATISRFFGFTYQKVPQDDPPAVDWWTGQPLTYDVNHSDGYILLGSSGVERFSTGAGPDFSGTLNPRLHAFLNDEGLDHLAHPPQPGWTPADALASLGWLLGRTVPSQGG